MLDLVAGRKVFLQDGQAYVSKTDIVSLVVGHFRYFLNFLGAMMKDDANVHVALQGCSCNSDSQQVACWCRNQLSQALVETARKWASHIAAEESERLTPVVEALSTR